MNRNHHTRLIYSLSTNPSFVIITVITPFTLLHLHRSNDWTPICITVPFCNLCACTFPSGPGDASSSAHWVLISKRTFYCTDRRNMACPQLHSWGNIKTWGVSCAVICNGNQTVDSPVDDHLRHKKRSQITESVLRGLQRVCTDCNCTYKVETSSQCARKHHINIINGVQSRGAIRGNEAMCSLFVFMQQQHRCLWVSCLDRKLDAHSQGWYWTLYLTLNRLPQ